MYYILFCFFVIIKHMKQFTIYLLQGIFITCMLFPTFSQTQEKNTGNWLISRTSPTIDMNQEEKKENFENFVELMNSLLESNITPQALDRNDAGEMMILSQTTPPAQLARNWILQSYKNEKEMLQDIESKSKENIYPIGLDVQKDGAYVLFLQSQLTMKNFRLIKVQKQETLTKSIDDYLSLGLIPIAVSSFNESIWVMLASFKEIIADSLELQIKITPLDTVGTTLDTVLQNETSQIRAFTTISTTNALLIIQHNK